MNWLASRVTLRVRSLSDILDLGLIFCTENRKTYGKLALAVLAPPFALCVGLQLWGVPWWAIWSVAIVLGAAVEGAFTAAAGQLLFTESIGLGAALAAFGRRLVPYLAARTTSVLALLACSFLVIPVPAIAARAIFVPEYCLLEGAGPLQCLKRGGRLMNGRMALGTLLSLCLVLARLAFIAVGELLGQSLVEFVLQLGQPLGALFHDGGSTYALAAFFVSIPYVASARFLGYVDSRTRREGWDIQVRFAALLQRAATEEAAA